VLWAFWRTRKRGWRGGVCGDGVCGDGVCGGGVTEPEIDGGGGVEAGVVDAGVKRPVDATGSPNGVR
jgi:hypothetical protein